MKELDELLAAAVEVSEASAMSADEIMAMARLIRAIPAARDRLSALPQQAGGEDGVLIDLEKMASRDPAFPEAANAARAIQALQAEVARLKEDCDAYKRDALMLLENAQHAQAALREAQEDARQLAASVHGAFKALNSRPPEPILKLANRYFPMKQRTQRLVRDGDSGEG